MLAAVWESELQAGWGFTSVTQVPNHFTLTISKRWFNICTIDADKKPAEFSHPNPEGAAGTASVVWYTQCDWLWNNDTVLAANTLSFLNPVPSWQEPCFGHPDCFTKIKSDHLIRNGKTFHILPTLNSSNFQHFEFMSVKSLMNFNERIPGKEGVVAGIIYRNWSSCSARVNQEIKTEGPLDNSENGPRYNEMDDNPCSHLTER